MWSLHQTRGGSDPALLDHLPYLTLNLAAAPPDLLRTLFDATRLTIAMHPEGDDITITVTLPGHELTSIDQAAHQLAAAPTTDETSRPAAGV